ncbi:MAG: peptidoglycan-binding protein [Oscillospiraceae bacterium]|jgi:hypothetical protein|nr:peptidoglycan-binding protein [Oscillospiraceae bacterium]
MITVLVYNNRTGRMERYDRELSQAMPYITGSTLSVREFRGKSTSNIIWTDRRAMEAWNINRSSWGKPIYVGYAFRRIGEGGHANQSQHYAGVSFDVGQNLDSASRSSLRNLASSLGVWGYVEPASLTPTWVHFDARLGPPACSAGYPLIREGTRGVYVCTLQDSLEMIGSYGVGIDGVFGSNTKSAVMAFQRQNGLSADGIVGCATWTALTGQANNYFRK